MKTILINNPMLVLIVMKPRFAFRGQLEHTPASAAIMQFVPTENNAKFCMNAEEDA
jgi:ethanolamine utilization cobalamin adenosyltransferase